MILVLSIATLLSAAPAHHGRMILMGAPSASSVRSASWAPSLAVQGVAPCLARQSKNRSMNVNNDDDSYRMKYSSTECRGDVRIEGKLRYSSDFERITGISNGGSIRIEEEDHGTTRLLEGTPSGSGLSFKWSVNGRERPYDAEAQQWFDAWTLLMFRELGFAATERATAMVHAGGAEAVLKEVGRMTSDYVQSTYLGVALEEGHLNAASVERVLAVAGAELESDYYMATTLTHASRGVEFNTQARRSYLTAASRIGSDYYKELVLADLLKNGRLERGEVADVLKQATMIGSDYYRAALLGSLATKYEMDSTLRPAYLSSVSSIQSDYYKLDVLKKLLTQREMADADLATILEAGRGIESDYYASELLTQVARKFELRGAAREAFMTNLNRIESKYYRSNVTSAMRRN
jgi:hypothetical protein